MDFIFPSFHNILFRLYFPATISSSRAKVPSLTAHTRHYPQGSASAKREFIAKITPLYSIFHKSNHTMSRTYEEEKADIQKTIFYTVNLEKSV
jgi:hypothetical protein